MTLAADGLQNAKAYKYTYADATARLAATGFVAADVGALALQLDTGNLYLLTATTPTWQAVGGTFTSPMTTAGDLILGGAGGAPGRLAQGADSTVLTIDPSTHLPVWATPSGGGSGATILIAEWRPTDGEVSHDFTIPSTVAEIEYVISGRGKEAQQYAGVALRFNGDTAANYDTERLGAGNTAVSGSQTGSAAGSGGFVGFIAGASATAGKQGMCQGLIGRVQDAVQHTWMGQEFREDTALNMGMIGGRHTGTAAITTLRIYTTDGNGFAVGAVVRVYGRLT